MQALPDKEVGNPTYLSFHTWTAWKTVTVYADKVEGANFAETLIILLSYSFCGMVKERTENDAAVCKPTRT